jgi:hypothetical protein
MSWWMKRRGVAEAEKFRLGRVRGDGALKQQLMGMVFSLSIGYILTFSFIFCFA